MGRPLYSHDAIRTMKDIDFSTDYPTWLTGRILGKLVLALLIGLLLFNCYRAVKSPAGDFANYYTASRLAITDSLNDVRLYDHFEFQKQIERYFHGTLGSFIPFPPSTALLMIPLAWLPPNSARDIFILVNMLVLCTMIVVLGRFTGISLMPLSILVLLDGFSLWSNFREGQVYLILTLLILLAFAAEKKGRHLLAGVLFGVVLPIKYITFLYVAYFFLRRRYRIVMGAALSALSIFLAGFFLTGLKLNEFYLTNILPRHLAGEIQNPFAVNFQSFNSLLNRLLVNNASLNPHPIFNSPLLALWLTSFISLIFLSLVISGSRSVAWRSEHNRVLYDCSLITLFGLVTSPASASYHLVLLIIPMAFVTSLILSKENREGKDYLRKRFALLAATYIAINLVPFQWLYGLPILQLFAYAKLFLLVIFFTTMIPPQTLRSKSFPVALTASLALSLLIVAVRSTREKETDGAIWAGFDGLIIADLSYHDGAIYYFRETPTGFISMRNGARTYDDPPVPERTSEEGIFTAFDSALTNSTEVFVRNNSTGTVRQMTEASGVNCEPVWSRDAKQLYFLSDRGRGIDCTTIFYLPISRDELP
ncbi:MAG TPA: glycosyltransferase 87 family protein [Candidatus Acidoferrales bacterium]|nr:glycosyltransferase 87 family protein [Candidatus Acidoferrales bacterium]